MNVDSSDILGEQRKTLVKYIQNRDSDKLKEEVGKLFKEKLKCLVEHSNNERGVKIYRIGCYYISPSFGTWLRFACDPYPKRYKAICRTEYMGYEERYQKLAPRNANILVHHGLASDIKIKFYINSRNKSIFNRCHMKEYIALISENDIFDLAFDPNGNKIKMDELKKYLKGTFYKKLKGALNQSELKNLRDSYGKEIGTKWINYLFRMLILSYYSTLQVLKKEMEQSNGNNSDPIEVLLKPICIIKDSDKKEMYACLAIAYNKKPGNIDEIIRQTVNLINEIFTIDLWNSHLASQTGRNLIFEEDIIKECTTIDKSVLSYVNKFPNYLEELLGKTHRCGNKNSRKIDCCEFHRLTKEIVCASTSYRDFLIDLNRKINPIDYNDEKLINRKMMSKIINGDIIYLYSMPGCGKENIAKLCHLLSWRSLLPIIESNKYLPLFPSDILGVTFKTNIETRCKNGLTSTQCDAICAYYPAMRCFSDKWGDYKGIYNNITKTEIKKIIKERNPYFNFYSVNAGAIGDDEFEETLFGIQEANGKIKYGHYVLAHRTRGTVFLDEFNTIYNKTLATKLLRVFQSPHEAYIKNMNKPIELNVFTVIAGNSNRDKLLQEGFSPAVVSRICGKEITIPPLKERPEDIAVFILHKCLEFNESIKKNNSLKRIEHSAMRLLCDMPWEDNYRQLKFFMDGLLNDMRYRAPAKGIISFESILKQLRKRDLLSGKIVRITKEAVNEK